MVEVLGLLFQCLLGAVFLMAGVIKASQPSRIFQDTLKRYALIPGFFLPFVARMLPFAEIALGLALFSGLMAQEAAAGILVLLVIFLAASITAIRRGLDLRCDCFGLLYRERIGAATVARDSLLIAMAIYIAAMNLPRRGITDFVSAELDVSNIFSLIALVGFLMLSSVLAGRVVLRGRGQVRWSAHAAET